MISCLYVLHINLPTGTCFYWLWQRTLYFIWKYIESVRVGHCSCITSICRRDHYLIFYVISFTRGVIQLSKNDWLISWMQRQIISILRAVIKTCLILYSPVSNLSRPSLRWNGRLKQLAEYDIEWHLYSSNQLD